MCAGKSMFEQAKECFPDMEFHIYHDALSQFTDKGCQDWMNAEGIDLLNPELGCNDQIPYRISKIN